MKNLFYSSFENNLPDNVINEVKYIFENNISYRKWFYENRSKIESKFKGLSEEEDYFDIVTELLCASVLSRSDKLSELFYEPLGTRIKAPDFKVVLFDGQEFYCEVRRIRRNSIEVCRDSFMEAFSNKIRLIQLNYGMDLCISNLKTKEVSEKQIYESLLVNIDEVVGHIERELGKIKELTEQKIINLDIFAEGMSVTACSIPLGNRTNRAKYYGSSYNCPMTQKEYMKFGDIIFDKLPQLVNDYPNLLTVFIDNDSHWYEDFEDSIGSIKELIMKKDNCFFKSKGYLDYIDFVNQFKKLSGVFILSQSFNGKLWLNGESENEFSDEMLKYLEGCK